MGTYLSLTMALTLGMALVACTPFKKSEGDLWKALKHTEQNR